MGDAPSRTGGLRERKKKMLALCLEDLCVSCVYLLVLSCYVGIRLQFLAIQHKQSTSPTSWNACVFGTLLGMLRYLGSET